MFKELFNRCHFLDLTAYIRSRADTSLQPLQVVRDEHNGSILRRCLSSIVEVKDLRWIVTPSAVVGLHQRSVRRFTQERWRSSPR
ncbi:MAG: hypothetical protein IPM83_11430 [Ignavibacteria bacterium]|nr:hypothetical protein [Ignavibacteria bacterium]